MTRLRRMCPAWGSMIMLLLAARSADTHDTWLLPEKFQVPVGEVRLGMTSGMEFPKPETAVKAERIARSGVRIGGADHALKLGEAVGGALSIAALVGRQGIAVIWAQSLPRTIELKPDQVSHWFEEVGAPQVLVTNWASRGRRGLKDTYIKLAKAYVRVGTAEDTSWRDPIGLVLELVPSVDPTRLHAGAELPLQVLWEGKTLAGVAVTAIGPESKALMVRSDADGRVSLRLGTAGPWLVKATRVIEAPGRENELDAQFTTITFEVR